MLHRLEPTDSALRRFCSMRTPGELSPQLVGMHAPDASLLLEDGDEVLARCSLWWSTAPSLPGRRVGVLGHYAARDLGSAARMLDSACTLLREAGCTIAIGPMDGSTWRRYRLLSSRGRDPLFFLEPDNPDEWPAHFVGAGFAPLANYCSSRCDDLGGYPVDEALHFRLMRLGYRTRAIDMSRFEDELDVLWRLASDAFSHNFLYSPVTETEFRQMYAPAAPKLQPELVRIAEFRGEPVAMIFAVPDFLQACRGEPIDTVIFKSVGVGFSHRGQRLGSWLVDSVAAKARELGFRRAVFALLHEANPSRRIGLGVMRDFRRYTLYSRNLV